MARPKRLDPTGGWHHVMSRGVNRGAIYFDDDDRLQFGQLLSTSCERFDVEVHAYCLMTNHFHLLVRCPEAGLSDSMHHLLSVYAQAVNDRSGRTGHLFAGRFVSRGIASYRYLANVVRYIHRNPLDIAGVEHPADYRWSSHRHYLGLRSRPSWLHTRPVGTWFGDVASFESFVSGSSRVSVPVTIPDVTVAEEFLRTIDLLISERTGDSGRHLPAQRRAIALGALEHIDPKSRSILLDSLGLVRDSSADRQARYRSKALLAGEPGLQSILDLSLELFGSAGAVDLAA